LPTVARPVMIHHWEWITFVHWRFPVSELRPLVPPALEVETFDGSAWVGLTPFLMRGVRPPGLPAVPWLSRFPEINVRTYVRDQRGRSGIWFLSLDAARLPAVLTARAAYALPYFWSDMRTDVRPGGRVSYRCRRRWPASDGARCEAEVEFGARLREEDVDELAHFLTARYRLFTVIRGRLAAAEAEHPVWPLHHVDLIRLDQTLLSAAGLPTPDDPATVHGSSGVAVRVGWWHH
ncbi:MAG TPA: DUF2071 domain-containing protein, partial [Micromonosporaceae bacterium]|nr:DUF2071 domain-containing protein [Micromonosporaceae bacterium]